MDKQNQVDSQPQPSSTASKASVTAKEKEISPSKQRQRNLKSKIYRSEIVEEHGQLVASLVGYGLLVFSLFDYLHIVIPPQFTNFVWEFQTIGALVEHVATALLGLAIIFYRPQGYVTELERKLLGCLSWVSLLLGIIYLLMLPLGITDTWRLYRATEAQVSAQISQQIQPLQQLQAKLNQAKTDEQLKQVLASLTPENRIPEIQQPQKVRDTVLTKISQSQQNIKKQAQAVGANQKKALLKDSVKWNLGALIAGSLFIVIWYLTGWARSRTY